MSYSLPPVSKLSQLSHEDQAEALGHLFEPCETLSAFIITRINQHQFNSYQQLIEFVREELLRFLQQEEKRAESTGQEIDPRISKIIAAHPRLGGSSSAPADKLSVHSTSEQKSLQGSAQETQRLIELNDLYEATFPGLRYVVFVNGRSRKVVMENMEQRIRRNDIASERVEAFNAMCDIAHDRARKLLRQPASEQKL